MNNEQNSTITCIPIYLQSSSTFIRVEKQDRLVDVDINRNVISVPSPLRGLIYLCEIFRPNWNGDDKICSSISSCSCSYYNRSVLKELDCSTVIQCLLFRSGNIVLPLSREYRDRDGWSGCDSTSSNFYVAGVDIACGIASICHISMTITNRSMATIIITFPTICPFPTSSSSSSSTIIVVPLVEVDNDNNDHVQVFVRVSIMSLQYLHRQISLWVINLPTVFISLGNVIDPKIKIKINFNYSIAVLLIFGNELSVCIS